MMINSKSTQDTYNPYGQDPYNGYGSQQQQQPSGQDMYYTMLMNEKMQREEKKNEYTSKTSEILMQSLDKQNQILAKLASNIGKERDDKITQEAKEIEYRIKQLEFETQAKQHQLFSQNLFDNLSTNYNSNLNSTYFIQQEKCQTITSKSSMISCLEYHLT